MAPKNVKAAKKNNAVELLKKALEEHRLPLTADGIKQLQAKEGSKATKPLVDACSYAMRNAEGGGLDAFKALKGDERYSHLARFALDPATAGIKFDAENKHTVARSEQQGWEFEDLTLKQLGSPNWLNDELHAANLIKTLVIQGEAPGSTPEYRIPLYRYWYYKGHDTINKLNEASTTAKTEDMGADAFNTARDAFRRGDPLLELPASSSREPPLAAGQPDTKKIKIEPEKAEPTGAEAADIAAHELETSLAGVGGGGGDDPKPEDDAEDPEFAAKVADLEKALKEAKLQKDTMTKKLDMVPLITSSLQKKPFDTTATISWLETKTTEQKDALKGLMDEWVAGKSVLNDVLEDTNSMTKLEKLDKLTEKKTSLETLQKKIEQSYTKYKNNVLGEFSKLVK